MKNSSDLLKALQKNSNERLQNMNSEVNETLEQYKSDLKTHLTSVQSDINDYTQKLKEQLLKAGRENEQAIKRSKNMIMMTGAVLGGLIVLNLILIGGTIWYGKEFRTLRAQTRDLEVVKQNYDTMKKSYETLKTMENIEIGYTDGKLSIIGNSKTKYKKTQKGENVLILGD